MHAPYYDGIACRGFDHPPNKNEMSRRLALQAVHAAFGVQGRLDNGALDGVTSSLWTGPVLDNITAVVKHAPYAMTVTLSFLEWSASGLALQDVKAGNIDGSRNDCTKCCARAPPFEVQAASNSSNNNDGTTNNNTWTRIPFEQITVSGSAIEFTTTEAVGAVRYAYSDYVDCIVVNNDSLVLAPFVEQLAQGNAHALATPTPNPNVASGASSAPIRAKKNRPIEAPPMGFNSWNYYHCNIDENIVKQMADTFISTGMAVRCHRCIMCGAW